MGMVLENGVWILKNDSPWTVEYEVDFRTVGTHDFTTEANTYDIHDVTWSAAAGDLSEETKFELTSEKGLEISALPGSNNWYSSGRACPVLSAVVSDLVSGLAVDDTIAFQLAQSSATLANNWQANGLGLFDGSGTVAGDSTTTNAVGFICARNFYEGGVTFGAIRNTLQDKYSGTQGDFFEIVWYPAAAIYTAVGTIGDADFNDPLIDYTYQGYAALKQGFGSNSAGSPTYGMPEWDIRRPGGVAGDRGNIGIFANSQQQSGGGATTTTAATRFRVLRRRKT